MNEEKSLFEKRIKPVLMYVGTIGACLSAIVYIIVACILIWGFKVEKTLNLTIFSVVNAIVGLVIMFFLKVQGIDFAKSEPETKKIMEKYYGVTTKDKKTHSISYFWVTSTIKDVTIKGLSLAVMSAGLIYLVIAGNGDTKLILLAIANLLLFTCFGFLSLVKAYEAYKYQHVKFMKDKLEEVGELKEETKHSIIEETQKETTQC